MKVTVQTARIARGVVGKNLTLLHIPTDRFVTLYEHGRTLWEKLEQGTTDIVQLVSEHVQECGVPIETAAFEVITFLDELRAQGFIDFALERERETAPLLDAQTDLSDARAEHVLRLISGRRPYESHPLVRIASLADPGDAMTLAEIRQAGDAAPAIAARTTSAQTGVAPTRDWYVVPYPSATLSVHDLEILTGAQKGVPAATVRRIVHLHGPSPDVTVGELETIAQLGFESIDVDRRGTVDILGDVRADLTIGDLEQLAARRGRIVVVVVIVLGPVIIIIVIDGGTGAPGPGGKSRNACKTMCV